MDPKQLRKLVRRWAIPVVLITAVGGIVAFAIAKHITPTYTAEATVLVQAAPNQAVGNTGVNLNADQLTSTAASLMTQPPLLQRVINELHLTTTSEALAKQVTSTPQVNSELVTVSVSDPDPDRAARIANTVSSDFVAQTNQANQQRMNQAGAALQQQIATLNNTLNQEENDLIVAQQSRQDTTGIKAEIAANSALLSTLTGQYATLQATQAQSLESVSVAAAASKPLQPSSPKVLLDTALGLVAGLLLALGIAALVEYLDQGLSSEEDVRERLGVPCLAVIPRFYAGSQHRQHRDADRAQEAYRRLRTNLLFSELEGPLKSIVITSVRPGEGKTRTAANLAVALATSEQAVLLVDADMRRPAQHRLFGKPLRNGMSEMLIAATPGGIPSLNGSHATQYENLGVITCGVLPPNPSELLASSRTRFLIRGLEQQCDVVVLDTPPAPAVTDALSVAAHTSGAIVVVEAGKTNAEQARVVINALRGVHANVLGVVLNKAKSRKLGAYYYYYEGGNTTTVTDRAPTRTAAAAATAPSLSTATATSTSSSRPIAPPPPPTPAPFG
jgi:non-specific protein-tyrosine kinase